MRFPQEGEKRGGRRKDGVLHIMRHPQKGHIVCSQVSPLLPQAFFAYLRNLWTRCCLPVLMTSR